MPSVVLANADVQNDGSVGAILGRLPQRMGNGMVDREVDVEAHDSGLERLVMFSDGVFAIAITLLVIDLKVPEVPEANGAPDLGRAVWEMGPSFFAYVLSFLVIGI